MIGLALALLFLAARPMGYDEVSYKRKLTMTAGGGGGTGILRINVADGGYFELDSLVIGADDYAVGGRSISAGIYDADGFEIEPLFTLAGVDNQRIIALPTFRTSDVAAGNASRRAPFRLQGGESIRIQGTTLGAGETMTVRVRGRATSAVTFTTGSVGYTLTEEQK